MIIAIVGFPGSGKSTLSKHYESLKISVYPTDDYIGRWGFKEFPDKMIHTLASRDTYVIEGVQVARMLRTGFRMGTWSPDMVIEMIGGDDTNPISRTVSSAMNDWKIESKKPYYSMRWK